MISIWKTDVIPLNYTREIFVYSDSSFKKLTLIKLMVLKNF